MYSRLTTPPGETPTKVVLEGVEPGSPAALALFNQHRAAITQFQSKARQARQISEQSGSHMHQSLPDGGMMRYVYNQGQETVYVRVAPRSTTTTTETTSETKPPQSPALAIDVLFTPKKFDVADIYRIEESTKYHPAVPPEDITYPYGSDDTINVEPFREGTGAADYSEYVVTQYVPGSQGLIGERFFPSQAAAEAAMQLAFDNPENVATAAQYPGYGGTYSVLIGGYTRTDIFGGSEYVAWYDTFRVARTAGVGHDFSPGTPAYYEDIELHFREKRDYLDMLPVVALRVAGDKPYEALSVEPGEDSRLTPLLGGEKVGIQRQIALEDAAGGKRFYGAGFVARPKDPAVKNVPPTAIDIEVWVGSANVKQHNPPPGAVGSAFEVDDPTMEYETETGVTLMIRAREFADGAYQVVRVTTQGQGRIERFKAPGDGTGSPDVSIGVELPLDARSLDWRFAAAPGWTDSGQEPASPLALTGRGVPGMGKLLDELLEEEVAVDDVAPAATPPRTVPRAPAHAGGAQELTQIATIRWTPSKDGVEPGTAEIVPA